MTTLSLSEAKIKLSGLLDELGATGEAVVVTRNGRPAAVMVTPEEFEGWRETVEVLADKELMADIRKGLRQLKSKKSRTYSADDLLG